MIDFCVIRKIHETLENSVAGVMINVKSYHRSPINLRKSAVPSG